MRASKETRDFLSKMNHDDLLEHAKDLGNETLYLYLIVNKDLEKVSDLLNLRLEYEGYFKSFNEALDRSSMEASTITGNYREYLLEKICFPEGEDDMGSDSHIDRSISDGNERK